VVRFLPFNFTLRRDGDEVARYRRVLGKLRDRYVLELDDGLAGVDRRLVLAFAVALDALQTASGSSAAAVSTEDRLRPRRWTAAGPHPAAIRSRVRHVPRAPDRAESTGRVDRRCRAGDRDRGPPTTISSPVVRANEEVPAQPQPGGEDEHPRRSSTHQRPHHRVDRGDVGATERSDCTPTIAVASTTKPATVTARVIAGRARPSRRATP
jgi:hypothetical protein